MRTVLGFARDYRRSASWTIVSLIWIGLISNMSGAVAGPTQEKFSRLSQKEITFLKTVFSGDDAKAAEYAELAGINPNLIGGEPLSVWFYDMDEMMAPGFHRNLRVQKIVFERFKQNPNPPLRDPRGMQGYCAVQNIPANMQISVLKQHVDAMVAGFDSLRHYGLTDRGILNAMISGCVFPVTTEISDYVYDNLVVKLMNAGADINLAGTQFGPKARPIELAVQRGNVHLLERLIRDGAQVKFDVATSCPSKTNLYGYFLDQATSRDTYTWPLIASLLNSAGLSADHPVVAAQGHGPGNCRPTTLYDEAITVGNLDLAKAIKAALATAPPSLGPSPVKSAAPVVAQPAATEPATITDPVKPVRFGAWSITADPNGRPVAASLSSNAPDVTVRRLQLECAAGGRLEYVPVPAKASAINSLWVSGMDEVQSELALVNGRASGKSAAWLSQAFLKAEATAAKSGEAKWGLSVVADNPNLVAVTDIVGTGFSQMRSYMLAHCKT